MEGRCIIPVEPASASGETVVVEVQQTGSHPLDVRLVGCEGESPYVTKIKQGNIGKLKHKFKGSDDEWEAVLSHFLLQKQPEGVNSKSSLLDNVRMVYAWKGDNIEISIRQDVKGIKVTLGEILLPKDEDFEFNPFEWAQASAQAHSRTLQELAELRARVHGEQDTIAKLSAQLDDFIKTKNETETAMLQQFTELLNEKKRKIRDQSRILAGAKVDPTAASAVKSAREETKARKAGASRAPKRKAPAKAAEPEPPSDEEQMEIDEAKAEEQDDESGREASTPDRASDEETEDDEDDAVGDAAPSSVTARPGSGAPGEKGEPVAPKGAPPRRELPFARPATRGKPTEKQPSRAADDDDDETEDEEL